MFKKSANNLCLVTFTLRTGAWPLGWQIGLLQCDRCLWVRLKSFNFCFASCALKFVSLSLELNLLKNWQPATGIHYILIKIIDVKRLMLECCISATVAKGPHFLDKYAQNFFFQNVATHVDESGPMCIYILEPTHKNVEWMLNTMLNWFEFDSRARHFLLMLMPPEYLCIAAPPYVENGIVSCFVCGAKRPAYVKIKYSDGCQQERFSHAREAIRPTLFLSIYR